MRISLESGSRQAKHEFSLFHSNFFDTFHEATAATSLPHMNKKKISGKINFSLATFSFFRSSSALIQSVKLPLSISSPQPHICIVHFRCHVPNKYLAIAQFTLELMYMSRSREFPIRHVMILIHFGIVKSSSVNNKSIWVSLPP